MTSQTAILKQEHAQVTEQVLQCAAQALKELKSRLEREASERNEQMDFVEKSMLRLKHGNDALPVFKSRAARFCRKLQYVPLNSATTDIQETQLSGKQAGKGNSCHRKTENDAQNLKTQNCEYGSSDAEICSEIAREIHRYSSKILESLDRLTRQFSGSMCERLHKWFKPGVACVLVAFFAGSLAYFGGDCSVAMATGVGLATGVCFASAVKKSIWILSGFLKS